MGGEPPAGKPPRRPRLATIIALVIVGLAVAGGGIGGLVWTQVRQPTPAQVNAAGDTAFGFQWRWLSGGQIFPARVPYTTTAGTATTASLVGIAPQAPCAATMDPGLGRVLSRNRCVTMLRATYADQSRTVLVTIGFAVLPSAAAATAVAAAGEDSTDALLPLSFPGTVASQFTVSARESSGQSVPGGPYIIYYTVGYADGRKTTLETDAGESAATDLQNGVVNAISTTFTQSATPCTLPEVRC